MGENNITTLEELKKEYAKLRKDFESLHTGMMKMYQALSDDNENLIYIYDSRNKIVYANKRSMELFDIPEKTEFEGECPLMKFIEEEDREKVRDQHKEIESGKIRESKTTLRVKFANSIRGVYEQTLLALCDYSGTNTGVCVGILRDVTERYVKDARVKQYSKIMHSSVPLVLIYDQKKDKLTLIPKTGNQEKNLQDERNTYFWSKMIKDEKVCSKADIPVLLNYLKEGSEKPIQINIFSTLTEEYRWYALTGQVKDDILTGEAVDITDYKMKEIENKHVEKVLECLNDEFTLIAEIDLDKDTYEVLLFEKNDKDENMEECGIYSKLNEQLSQRAAPEYQQMRKEFGEISRLKEALKDRKKIECEYKLANEELGWRRITIQVMEADENGTPKKVILVRTGVEEKTQVFQKAADEDDSVQTTTVDEISPDEEIEKEKKYIAKVLLVEHFSVNAEYTKDILDKAGIETIWAQNADEAVRRVQDYPADYFSLVLMDTKMPDKDGYEATKEIRAFAEKLPVIGLSVTDDEEHKQMAREAGMAEHMQKPVTLAQVFYLINKYVKKEN